MKYFFFIICIAFVSLAKAQTTSSTPSSAAGVAERRVRGLLPVPQRVNITGKTIALQRCILEAADSNSRAARESLITVLKEKRLLQEGTKTPSVTCAIKETKY